MNDPPRKAYSTDDVRKQIDEVLALNRARLRQYSRPSDLPATHASTPVRTPADLGLLVRQAREAMNLTQTEFADMAGVGRRFVSELENGKATLELGKVMAACAAAGIDLLAAQR